jgi:hypothetical protein
MVPYILLVMIPFLKKVKIGEHPSTIVLLFSEFLPHFSVALRPSVRPSVRDRDIAKQLHLDTVFHKSLPF